MSKKGAKKKASKKKSASKKGAKKTASKKKPGSKKKVAKKKTSTKKASTKKTSTKKASTKKTSTKKTSTNATSTAPKKAARASAPAAAAKPARKTAPPENKKKPTVDEYLGGLSGWMSIVGQMVRRSFAHAAPDATSSVKWAQPVWEDHGPFAYLRAYGNHMNLGFWRGAQLPDPHGLLQGDGDRMKHIALHRPEDYRPQHVEELIRAAVELNRAHGDPTRRSSGDAAPPP
ncbi:MAG: DUF1801 domain-containing protein [Sandaracinaceae bacterium]